MLDKIAHMVIETIDRLEALNKKIDDLDKKESEMAWEEYEAANMKLNDDILQTLDFIYEQTAFLDEQLDELNQGEEDMTREAYDLAWDVCDEAYTILLDYQTELVGLQANNSSKLLQGYAEELGQLEFEAREASVMSNAVKDLKNTIWQAIKKGASYAWDNKEKWYQIMMEKGYEAQENIMAQKSNAELDVNRHSAEKLKVNVQTILDKYRNGDVLSVYEKYYVEAAKRKLGI